jgi:anti-sigma-K factor RskA
MTDDLHQLAAPYALGALADDELATFEQHLGTCAECQDEVRGFALARDELGRSSASPAPPDLRARVLAEAAATPQVPPLVSARRSVQQRSRWQTMGRGLLAAAAAGLVAVGGFAYAQVRSDRSDAEALVAVLTAPDAVTMSLAGSDGERLQMVWSEQRGEAALVGSGLDDPGRGNDFELWFLSEGEPRPALVFEPTDGSVRERFDVTDAFDGLAVTIEPDGGSEAPTSPPIFQVAAS